MLNPFILGNIMRELSRKRILPLSQTELKFRFLGALQAMLRLWDGVLHFSAILNSSFVKKTISCSLDKDQKEHMSVFND